MNKKSKIILFILLTLLTFLTLYFIKRNSYVETTLEMDGSLVLVKDEKTIPLYKVIANIKESELSEYNYTFFKPASEEIVESFTQSSHNKKSYSGVLPGELFYFKIYLTKEELENFISNEKVYIILPPFLEGYKTMKAEEVKDN